MGSTDGRNGIRVYSSDPDGLYADFHSLRHWFITGLARASVSPKMAQTLARHSDIRLTLGVYTHSELTDRTAANEALPTPPDGDLRGSGESERSCRTGTNVYALGQHGTNSSGHRGGRSGQDSYVAGEKTQRELRTALMPTVQKCLVHREHIVGWQRWTETR